MVTNIRSEKFMDRAKTAAGEKFLAGDSRETLFQKRQESNFAIAARRKIGGAAFGWSGAMPVSIPVKDRFAESRPRGNHRDIFLWMIYAAIQVQQIRWPKILQTASRRDQIIHQDDTLVPQSQAGSHGSGDQHPRHRRGRQPAIDDVAR